MTENSPRKLNRKYTSIPGLARSSSNTANASGGEYGVVKTGRKPQYYGPGFLIDVRPPFLDHATVCVVCHKLRPELAQEHNDPYCSNKCCRIDHGLAIAGVSTSMSFAATGFRRAS